MRYGYLKVREIIIVHKSEREAVISESELRYLVMSQSLNELPCLKMSGQN